MEPQPSSHEATPESAATDEDVAWAQKVNRRWIVHRDLRGSTEDYLDHLNRMAPDRLVRSARRAREMIRRCPHGDDPKPWFYGGLFSLATADEARLFLSRHWFTRCTVPAVADPSALGPEPSSVAGQTLETLERVRQAIAELAKLAEGEGHPPPRPSD